MTATENTYRVLGTTDDVTTCGVCGREELKGTIVLDSGEGTVYAGSDCGAKLAGKPVREIRRDAKTADDEKKRAARLEEQTARTVARNIEEAEFALWLFETYGLTMTNGAGDLWDKVPGKTPFDLRKEFRASR